jgi:hypothetical protein
MTAAKLRQPKEDTQRHGYCGMVELDLISAAYYNTFETYFIQVKIQYGVDV